MPISRRDLIIGALAVGAGCSREATSTARNRPPVSVPQLSVPEIVPQPRSVVTSMAMIGDSITRQSRDALTYVFNAQGITDVVIDAENSRRIAVGNGTSEPLNGQRALSNLVADGVNPNVWVIALGTNDVGQYTEEQYGVLIDSMLATAPGDAPVVWVDVYRPSVLDATRHFNELLRERAEQLDRLTVASWFDLASDPGSRLLIDDGVHPNRSGETAFAVLVGGAVASIG